MRGGLESKGSCWWLLKLANMSTITREWIALQHAHLVPFLSVLLTGQPTTAPESKHLDIPPGMRTMMEKECNTSQVRNGSWILIQWFMFLIDPHLVFLFFRMARWCVGVTS